eukprot:3279579-Prymnesium_polylepis.2
MPTPHVRSAARRPAVLRVRCADLHRHPVHAQRAPHVWPDLHHLHPRRLPSDAIPRRIPVQGLARLPGFLGGVGRTGDVHLHRRCARKPPSAVALGSRRLLRGRPRRT